MKGSLLSLGAVAALAALAGAAITLPAADEALDRIEMNLDRAIDQLQQKAADRDASREAYEHARDLLKQRARAAMTAGYDKADTDAERLTRALDRLEGRAARAALDAKEYDRYRIRVVDSRLDRAIAWLEQKARDRGATREQFQNAVALLEKRAQLSKKVGSRLPSIREALSSKISALQAKAAEITAPEALSFGADIVDTRLERALAWLEEKALERKATREDFDRVRDILVDRADLAMRIDATAPDLRQRWLDAVARLEERAKEAGLTREDFLELRDALTKRAAEAGAGR